MFSAIVGLLWRPKKEECVALDIDESYKILNEPSEERDLEKKAVDKPVDEDEGYMCSTKTGIITGIESINKGNYKTFNEPTNNITRYIIDDLYKFESDLKDLKIGTKVSFVSFIEDFKAHVSNVTIIDNDWGYQSESSGQKWGSRVVVGKVEVREGRKLTVQPRNIVVDLNSVNAEFIPVVGDWVELDVKHVLDEGVADLFGTILEVNKISPTRPKVLEGVIRQWDLNSQSGVINNNVYFNRDVLSIVFLPQIGDEVIAEVIESDQGACSWRAIKIHPKHDRPSFKESTSKGSGEENTLNNGNHSNENLKDECDEEDTDYQKTHPDIFISDDITVTLTQPKEQSSITISVLNKTDGTITLNSVTCKCTNSNIKITHPKFIRNYRIQGHDGVQLRANCQAKSVGITKELLLFKFANFTIGRWVLVNLEVNRNVKHSRYNSKSFYQADNFYSGKTQRIRGEGPVIPPRFIPKRLQDYPVPQRLVALLKEALSPAMQVKRLTEMKPVLVKQLSYQTYEDFFHTLLHVEEIHMEISMRIYDQERASFIPNGEFLMLEVENLAEKRPSLLLGDKIIAKNPAGDVNVYEGCIHKVTARYVYLKFNKSFHESYNGEDYTIRAEASRTSYRRQHQAVSLTIRNVGRELLFPSKVTSKGPQAIFDYDKYEDVCPTIGRRNSRKANGEADRNSPNGQAERSPGGSSESSRIVIEDSPSSQKQPRRMVSYKELVKVAKAINERNSQGSSPDASVVSDSDSSEVSTPTKPQGAKPEGTKPEGEKPEGEKPQGAKPEGKKPEGAKLDGAKLEGAKPEGAKRQEEALKPNPKRRLKLEWYDKTLNFFQKEAVRNIILGEARPLPYIIFGPPGTGKTVTIVEVILQILRLMPHSRLLIAAPGNSAADLIALKLIESGVLKPGVLVRMVAYRVFLEDNIPPKLIPYCATVSLARPNTQTEGPEYLENGMRLSCTSDVIGRHRITIGTCGSLGALYSMGFAKGHFTHFIIDEAGQATEPEIMIPLSMMDNLESQTILAGDPMQLNPVVLSVADQFGLSESYLERLINRFPYIRDPEGFPKTGGYDPRLVTRLVYNYRSLPEIIVMPNRLFYDSELRPTISETDSDEADLLRKIAEVLPERKGKLPPAVVFHGVNGENYQTEDSPSWFNLDEISQVFIYLNEFYRLGLKPEDIGIVSPYIKQVRHLRTILNEADFALPKIGSIEEFQGQERKVIILSTVRSNTHFVNKDLKHSIGFLGHPKRINVALTRAQCLTVIVGNPHLLSTDPHWRSVLNFCRANGSYKGCEFHGIT